MARSDSHVVHELESEAASEAEQARGCAHTSCRRERDSHDQKGKPEGTETRTKITKRLWGPLQRLVVVIRPPRAYRAAPHSQLCGAPGERAAEVATLSPLRLSTIDIRPERRVHTGGYRWRLLPKRLLRRQGVQSVPSARSRSLTLSGHSLLPSWASGDAPKPGPCLSSALTTGIAASAVLARPSTRRPPVQKRPPKCYSRRYRVP